MNKPMSECSYMAETAAAVALAAANIPTDIQELLLRGNPNLGVAPGALRAALCAAVTTTAAFEGGGCRRQMTDADKIAELERRILELERHSHEPVCIEDVVGAYLKRLGLVPLGRADTLAIMHSRPAGNSD